MTLTTRDEADGAAAAAGERRENGTAVDSEERRDDEAERGEEPDEEEERGGKEGLKPAADRLEPSGDADSERETGDGGTDGWADEDSMNGDGSWWRATLREGMGMVTGVRLATGDSSADEREGEAATTLLLRCEADEAPSTALPLSRPAAALPPVVPAEAVMAADGLQATLTVGYECVQASCGCRQCKRCTRRTSSLAAGCRADSGLAVLGENAAGRGCTLCCCCCSSAALKADETACLRCCDRRVPYGDCVLGWGKASSDMVFSSSSMSCGWCCARGAISCRAKASALSMSCSRISSMSVCCCAMKDREACWGWSSMAGYRALQRLTAAAASPLRISLRMAVRSSM